MGAGLHVCTYEHAHACMCKLMYRHASRSAWMPVSLTFSGPLVLPWEAQTRKNRSIATKTQARTAPGWARAIHHGHLDVSPSNKEQTSLLSWLLLAVEWLRRQPLQWCCTLQESKHFRSVCTIGTMTAGKARQCGL